MATTELLLYLGEEVVVWVPNQVNMCLGAGFGEVQKVADDCTKADVVHFLTVLTCNFFITIYRNTTDLINLNLSA